MDLLTPKLFDIKDKIVVLTDKYTELQEANDLLLEENQQIKVENAGNLSKLEALDEQLNILKLSKSVSGSEEDKSELKKKLNEFIREIDKCLALLNN